MTKRIVAAPPKNVRGDRKKPVAIQIGLTVESEEHDADDLTQT